MRKSLFPVAFFACVVPSLAVADPCDGIHLVEPKKAHSGTFYVREEEAGRYHKAGYLPVGVLIKLVKRDGRNDVHQVPEARWNGRVAPYVNFISEYRQSGLVRKDSLLSLKEVLDQTKAPNGIDISCDLISRVVVPDLAEDPGAIIYKTSALEQRADNITPSYSVPVFLLGADEAKSIKEKLPYWRVIYRPAGRSEFFEGYVARDDQTYPNQHGKYRLSTRLGEFVNIQPLKESRNCSGMACYIEAIKDWGDSVENLEELAGDIIGKRCGLELELQALLGGEGKVGLPLSLIALSAIAEGKIKATYQMPATKTYHFLRWFEGDTRVATVFRERDCVGSSEGVTTLIRVSFSNTEEDLEIFPEDVLHGNACFSRVPTRLRKHYWPYFFIVGHSDKIIFPKYTALAHNIRSQLLQIYAGSWDYDELERRTWFIIERLVGFQRPELGGVPGADCGVV